MNSLDTDAVLRHIAQLVALLNQSYLGVEFAVALAIGSVWLFADSVNEQDELCGVSPPALIREE